MNESTVSPTPDSDKTRVLQCLKSLHLPAARKAYLSQKDEPDRMEGMSFDERLLEILISESENRAANSIRNRLEDAHLANPLACLEKVDIRKDRNLSLEVLRDLKSCEFISQKRHVSLEGAAGTGKTYLACALGHEACRKGYKVRYIRLPDILNEFLVARKNGNTKKVREQYLKKNLLILDEWLFMPVTIEYTLELLELVDACQGKTSLILCSQYPNEEWYHRIDCDRPGNENSTLTESVLDRIIHQMDVLSISSKESMRKYYSPSGEPVQHGKGK